MQIFKIGLVSVSDRASSGIYEDKGLPALKQWLNSAIISKCEYIEHLIADEKPLIEQTLIDLVDVKQCSLILTTGGTGPHPRDVTPDATIAVADRVMPGFGEQMRQVSLHFVPTAILSRQVGVIRGKCLILNLPGRPNSIRETLEGAKNANGEIIVTGIFASVPMCIDVISGAYLETNSKVIECFRPKN